MSSRPISDLEDVVEAELVSATELEGVLAAISSFLADPRRFVIEKEKLGDRSLGGCSTTAGAGVKGLASSLFIMAGGGGVMRPNCAAPVDSTGEEIDGRGPRALATSALGAVVCW